MKNKIIAMTIGMILLLATGILASGDVVVDENRALPLNVNAVTQTFSNGDGTYTMYLETNNNLGQSFNGNYQPPEESIRYAQGKVVLSNDIELISTGLIAPTDTTTYPQASVSSAMENGKTVLNWVLDLGMAPTSYKPSPIPNFQLPNYPRNTIAITFRVKEGLLGTIVPMEQASYSFTRQGETVLEHFWLNGVSVDAPMAPTITTTFYEDQDFTKETDEFLQGTPLYVKYVLSNPNDFSLENAVFQQNGTLTDVMVDWVSTGEDMAPQESMPVILAPGDFVITGKIQTDALSGTYENTGTITLPLSSHTSPITEENIANSANYILTKERTAMGDDTVEPHFSPGPFYGDGLKESYFYLLSSDISDATVADSSSDIATMAPNKPGTVTKAKETSFDTGDHNNSPLILIILIVSGILLILFAILAKKRKK